jgi:hypothetical protein
MDTLESFLRNIYRGDGWWDASRHWDKLKEIARQRDSQKSSYRSTKNWSAGNSTHFLGLVAEYAFSLETSIMLDLSLNTVGDPGYDFLHQGRTFDVKGTQYYLEPHLKQYPHPKTWVDFYMLAGINMEQRRVRIFGYATKEEMKSATMHDYGYGPQRVIKCHDLHPGMPEVLPSNRRRLGLDATVTS